MKKWLLLSICFLSVFYSSHAQDKSGESGKWSFNLQPKLGFAKYEETGSVTTNGTLNGFDVLISRKISKSFDLTSGFSFSTFDANRTAFGQTVRLQNDYLQIPLLVGGEINFDEENAKSPISMHVALGPSANFLLRQFTETTGGHLEDENVGWNFGFMTQISVDFRISNRAALYLGLQGQSDFSRIENDESENKIQQASSILFGYRGTF